MLDSVCSLSTNNLRVLRFGHGAHNALILIEEFNCLFFDKASRGFSGQIRGFSGQIEASLWLTLRYFKDIVKLPFQIARTMAMVFGASANLLRGIGASAVVAVGLALAGPAQAVEFIGFTDGCFGSGCIPSSSNLPATTTLGTTGLSYTNSTFDVTSSGGFAAIGGPPASPNVNNLGSFTLTSATNNYAGNDFNLLVSFTAPPGVSPTSVTFTDLISGSVTAGSGGGINVAFNTPTQTFSFDGGVFSLSVNNVSLTALSDASNSIAVSGTILVEAVPEASTWAMIMLGFLGVGFMAYRKSGPSFRVA
jgi:hypothetical protein